METVVLLTGGGGFIGRGVAKLEGRGSRSAEDLLPELAPMAPVVITPLDRADAAGGVVAARRRRPSARLVVLHLAWPELDSYAAGIGGSACSKKGSWEGYYAWTQSLAAAAEEVDAWFFGVGSGVEPYALAGTPTLGEPYLTYARRKADIRALLDARKQLRHYWLRLHFAFGPCEQPRRFVPAALGACRDGSVLAMGTPERRRHWLHVTDIGAGLLRAVAHPQPEDWDIVGPHAVTFGELCALIEDVTGRTLCRSSPESPPADADCVDIVPTNTAPFMPDGAGSIDYLARRLRSYRAWLENSSCRTKGASVGQEQ